MSKNMKQNRRKERYGVCEKKVPNTEILAHAPIPKFEKKPIPSNLKYEPSQRREKK